MLSVDRRTYVAKRVVFIVWVLIIIMTFWALRGSGQSTVQAEAIHPDGCAWIYDKAEQMAIDSDGADRYNGAVGESKAVRASMWSNLYVACKARTK